MTDNRIISYRAPLLMISVAVSLLTALAVSAIPSRPVPPRLVNDLADIFTWDEEMRLENALVAFDDTTSNQIAVVTVDDLEGYDASEYATRIGIDWQVGSAEFNNGVVVLVKPKTAGSDGEVFIAIGYGLEGAIPDAYARRIIENEMIPCFREGDYFGGVAQACETLMKLASGEISEPRDSEDEGMAALIAFLAVVVIAVIIIAVASGGKNGGGKGGGNIDKDAADVIGTILTYGSMMGKGGGGRSHGGFGGGGFSGGGFGGFGGGSFGGGGAGGRW